jgi:glycosyltransferase involved in cell wall biosynthesis
MLRVAATVEQSWHPVPGGTAVSVLETLRELGARDDVDVVGVAARHRAPPPEPWSVPAPVRHLPLPRRLLYPAWQYLRAPAVQRVTGPVDVVHAWTFAVPPRAGSPLVVTVHDLAFLRRPDQFTRNGVRFFRRGLELTRREADVVLCPSRATADDCERAGIGASRLRVVPHGVRPAAVPPASVEEFRRRHGLGRPYVLWCGTLEPRKNVGTLLAAFGRLVAEGADLDLLLVGPRGWKEASGVLPAAVADRVHALGFLPPGDLQRAYAGARAFAYPSTWEGFGLPVLEAMAHGVPVVTSAGTSMAEFAEGAGLLVDPLDEAGLAAALADAAGPRHDELASAASARAGRYTWAAAAEAVARAYRDVAG